MFRFCLPLVFAAAMSATPLAAETLSGPVRVVDADTIELGTPLNVRLIGIDAAEGAQDCTDARSVRYACGAMATEAAKRLYDGRDAICEVEGRDRNGRPLAVCYVDGRDINAELVRLGIARIYREGMAYEDRRYFEEQKEARLLARGLWAYTMVDPAVWRAERRTRSAPPRDVAAECVIKGNVSGGGRIYHLPGQRDYAATVIRESRGERWFCSEAEARNAGWRRARR